MPVIQSATAPTFDLPGLHVVGLASPSRGCSETSVWRVALAPNNAGTLHTVDREEIFVVIAGRAVAQLAGDTIELASGDALVVPANVPFALANPYGDVCEAIAVMPVGARASLPGGEPFAPPWTT
jgi:mannose-6-phosphate isomerase-like protein (cupin superfamily)